MLEREKKTKNADAPFGAPYAPQVRQKKNKKTNKQTDRTRAWVIASLVMAGSWLLL